MSNVYSKYRKELAGVKVVTSHEAYVFNNRTKRRNLPNPNFDIVGKVDMTMPNMILKANREDHRTDFIDDVSSLTKITKKSLVSHFYNEKGKRNTRTTAYLVRTDKQSKTTKATKPNNKK